MQNNKYFKLFFILFFMGSGLVFWSCTKADEQPGNSLQTNVSTGENGLIVLIHDKVEGIPVILAGSEEDHFIVSFRNELEGSSLKFEAIQDSLPIIMKDDKGNSWDITGTAVSGPSKGEKLIFMRSYMGYWFSWGTFFPGAKIYKNPETAKFQPRVYLSGEWLVPQNQVLSGGPGKDGIPALKNPEFLNRIEASYMNDEDLVLGVVVGSEARAYPHKILDWHEIINDKVQDRSIVITYCPLTGTGIGWNQDQKGITSTFGVSGLLYNSNLVPYDRETDSYWSQMRLDCIKGSRKGEKIETFQLIETTWKTWKKAYPNTRVVSSNTGYSRNYSRYPYGNYKTDASVYFPISTKDSRLHAKEVVHGIILNDKAVIYRFEHFQ